MNNKRIVITGMGAISPLGLDVETFWSGLVAGKSGVDLIDRYDVTDYPVKIAGMVKGFDPSAMMDKKLASRMDRYAQMGFVAAKQAVEQSGLMNYANLDKSRCGVTVGSGIGGLQSLADNADSLHQKGYRRVSPMFIPMSILDILSGYIAIEYGFTGANYAVTSACASGNHSMISAYNHIRLGDCDVVVAGGAEAAVTALGMAGFMQARALSTAFNDTPSRASRPFDVARDGFVMAEGAGIVVMESYEHAMKRNAPIFGEVIGYGVTADAYHITAPHPDGEGAGTAFKNAMKMANVTPDMIDLVNTHGTSTPLGDIAETKAVKFAMGDAAYKTNLNSTKSMIGHSLGAAGTLEAIAVMKMMETGMIHPTINLENPDPECDLNYTPNKAVQKEVNYAISNSFGFGGHNASVLFRKI
ncbi:MAG: beta-ketoacyl-ACP synthase II [Brevinema sp.]